MKTNKKPVTLYTHEGGKASPQTALQELTCTVSTCLLFENTFYERGSSIAKRIEELCSEVKTQEVADLAVKARTDLKLRHVPLFLALQLVKLRAGTIAGDTVYQVVQRPDEMGELLSLYWKSEINAKTKSRRNNGKGAPLANQLKRGLAKAFTKFNAYQLAKWNRDAEIKLKDVMFLTHPKPKDEAQAAVWKQLIDGTLPVPETWEVMLSSGKDKKETFEHLIKNRKLGYMALLMNLRNMVEAKVDSDLIAEALLSGAKNSKALPFRFISAAKHAPSLEAELSEAMELVIPGSLYGDTIVVVDVSGSMDAVISQKSTLRRWEAGGALAILLRQVSSKCRVFTFSDKLVEVANRRGIGLIDAIGKSQPHSGTYLRAALDRMKLDGIRAHRCVVITDEQSHDGIGPAFCLKSYVINVAPYQNGVGSDQGWTKINGFSERTIDWLALEETGRLLGDVEEGED